MRYLFFFFLFAGFLQAGVFEIDIAPKIENSRFMGIRVLDQKELFFDKIQGVKFAELSDVAYDDETNILYFVGDKGALFSFRAVFADKIEHLEPLRASRLKNKKGKKLKKYKRDSEGLVLDGRKRLIVSFEGEAKIAWFHKNSKRYGRLIKKFVLPKVLRNSKNYRSKNKSLEALAWHKRYGLLTATEWPLKKMDKKHQTIYALSGKKWHFRAEPESRTAVVAMEVMDNNSLLVVERSYTGFLNPFVITLKKIDIRNCQNRFCKTEVLAKMSSHKGWDIDNFEGLAKVGKRRYVMVSDNGDNFFQKTLLFYFEVL